MNKNCSASVSDEVLSEALKVAAVVLAAGQGSRFGSDKRFQPLPDGTPMALQSILSLLHAGIHTFVVIPPDDLLPNCWDQFVLTQLPKIAQDKANPSLGSIRWIECEDCTFGMGHSLSCGVRAVHLAGFEACLVALADMPYVQSSTMQRVAHALRCGNTLVRPVHNGLVGHPVGFAQEWFPQLIASTGDEGARPWLKSLKQKIQVIEVDDPGVLKDIDRLSDLE